MARWVRASATVLFALASACSDDTRACTDNYVHGLWVSVTDRSGNDVCDVTVRAQDGKYVEETTFDSSTCTFVGAGERAGAYDVSASRDGDVLASDRITVRQDGCHVEAESVTLVVD